MAGALKWIEKIPLALREPDAFEAFPWDSQAVQYPARGPAGISYFQSPPVRGVRVNCLLFRDEGGALLGILNHYPGDIPPHEERGCVNIWVRPDRTCRGVGTALLLEALRRWPIIDLERQRYTQAGLRLARNVQKILRDRKERQDPEG